MRDRAPDPQREIPFVAQPLEDPGRAEPAVLVVDGRDAARVRELDPGTCRLHPFVLRRQDIAVAEPPGRLLPEDAGRLALLVTLDDAACQVEIAVCGGERGGVQPGGVVVVRDHDRRRLAGDLVERLLGRGDVGTPVPVAPAVPAQPATARDLCFPDACECLVERRAAVEAAWRCASAQVGKWTCESVKAGRTQRPPRSTTSGSQAPSRALRRRPRRTGLRAQAPAQWGARIIVLTTPFSRIIGDEPSPNRTFQSPSTLFTRGGYFSVTSSHEGRQHPQISRSRGSRFDDCPRFRGLHQRPQPRRRSPARHLGRSDDGDRDGDRESERASDDLVRRLRDGHELRHEDRECERRVGHGQRRGVREAHRPHARRDLPLPRGRDEQLRHDPRRRWNLHDVRGAGSGHRSATSVTATSATLNGTVNPNGRATTLVLRVRDEHELRHEDRRRRARLGHGTMNVSAPVSGLTADGSTTTASSRPAMPGRAAAPTRRSPRSRRRPWSPARRARSRPTSANVRGTVNPNGQSTNWYFEYGTTTSYGTQDSGQERRLGHERDQRVRVAVGPADGRRPTTTGSSPRTPSGTTVGGDQTSARRSAGRHDGRRRGRRRDHRDARRAPSTERPGDDLVLRVRDDHGLRLEDLDPERGVRRRAPASPRR